MNNKRFLMVMTDLGMGGITTAGINLCNALFDNNNEVDVVVLKKFSSHDKSRFREGINVNSLNGIEQYWCLSFNDIKAESNYFKKILLIVLSIFKKLFNIFELWDTLLFGKQKRHKGYDVVFAYHPGRPCYYYTTFCTDAKCKIGFVHGDVDYIGEITSWEKYISYLDRLAFVSNGIKTHFLERYPQYSDKAVTIYNTVSQKDIRELGQSYGTDYDGTVLNIVTVSRLENRTKGILRIPILARMLKERYGNKFHWYVVGDGVCYDECQKITAEQQLTDVLTFVGEKKNPYPYIQNADLFVLTSQTEAYPMVVCESIVLGTPVVAARYYAFDEQLVEGKTGVCAEQNINSLFEKLCCLFNDMTIIPLMKKECKCHIFDEKRVFLQLKEAIKFGER